MFYVQSEHFFPDVERIGGIGRIGEIERIG